MKFNNTSNSQLERVYQDYYIDRSAKLGKGAYGKVYKGVDHQKRQIAIKILDTRNWNDKLEREIKVMQILR